MVNFLLAFVTGLTTGGLSCLAVQGGLLASSLAGEIEKDIRFANPKKGTRNQPAHDGLAKPILVFLTAKLFAYTVLGFFLGWIGQIFQLSLFARAVLQIAIGIFILGTALRMLNVHPIFRYFVFEPPVFLRRWLRSKSKNTQNSELAAPAFMGLLTVLIPCGVTQAMMAAALATGNPIESAALMFAFTLGTSPVFFIVSYFATQLGAKLEKYFVRLVAIVLIFLGFFTINSGLTLAGSPLSLTVPGIGTPSANAAVLGQSPAKESATAHDLSGADSQSTLTIYVKNYGYEPSVIRAKAGVPVRLKLVSEDVRSCALAFTIPSLNIQRLLKTTGEELIDIPAQKSGTRMPFSCSMGMYGGTILFDG